MKKIFLRTSRQKKCEKEREKKSLILWLTFFFHHVRICLFILLNIFWYVCGGLKNLIKFKQEGGGGIFEVS